MTFFKDFMKKHHDLTGVALIRSVRKSGSGSWAISIPREFADYANDKKNGRDGTVELYFLNGSMVVTPTPKQGYRIVGEDRLHNDATEEELISKVYSSFLGAYDRLKLKNYNKSLEHALKKILEKLPNVNIYPESADELVFDFTVPYEPPKNEADRAFRLCESLSKQNEEDMQNFPHLKEPGKKIDIHSPHHHFEQDVDKITFGAKRRLVTMASRPSFYKGVSIEDIRDCFEDYHTMINLERLCDLEDGISRHIRVLAEPELKLPEQLFTKGGYSILQYYCDTFEMVKSAYDSQKMESSKEAYDIIDTKNDMKMGIRYRGKFISLKNRINVVRNISTYHNKDYWVNWRLNLIEQSIWAMTRVATNLAELGQNLKRAEYKKEPKLE